MPLRDHFHPLSIDTPWSVFHGNWATKMVDRLNGDRLSDNYKAQAGRNLRSMSPRSNETNAVRCLRSRTGTAGSRRPRRSTHRQRSLCLKPSSLTTLICSR